LRIGIDLMGSDTLPHLLFEAVLLAAKHFGPPHSLVVFVTPLVVDQLKSLMESELEHKFHNTISFHLVTESIDMNDEPLGAVRRKKKSSIMEGMRLLKKKQIDAFVSSGNTGALVAGATLSLSRLPGVARPALLALLPTEKNLVCVLDVGGNTTCKAHHLVQFAYLGAAFQKAMGITHIPSVGLLNVGSESKKGTQEIRQAYDLLKAHCQELTISGMAPYMNFVGNIEGRDVFKGAVNVLVTDGFTGNVLLKSTEGTASFIFNSLAHACHKTHPEIFQEIIKELKKKFNYAEYPGAMICGVDGIVVKVHGDATAKAFYKGILGAADYVEKQVIANIKKQLAV